FKVNMSCRPIGKPSDPTYVCGECPYGDDETKVTRCHTTEDHGVASELCIYEKGVTVWSIEKEDCRACYQGSCDVEPKTVCASSGDGPVGCTSVAGVWGCSKQEVTEAECPKFSYCENSSCVPMESPPTHYISR